MPSFETPFNGIDLNKELSTEELVRILRFLIAAEFEAIQMYQQAVQTFADQDPLYKKVINSIIDEERIHAGEFMQLLKQLQPDEEVFYNQGTKEVEAIKQHKHL